MTRIIPFLAAASTAAFLAFGGAAAFAATTVGGHPGGPPAGPNGPAGNIGVVSTPRIYGCDARANQMSLDGPARRAYVWRCQQNGDS
jgi:hypothetical protein